MALSQLSLLMATAALDSKICDRSMHLSLHVHIVWVLLLYETSLSCMDPICCCRCGSIDFMQLGDGVLPSGTVRGLDVQEHDQMRCLLH